MNTVSTSIAGINQGFLIAGTQLAIASTTLEPDSNPSGDLSIISSLAVNGSTSISPVADSSNDPSGQNLPCDGNSTDILVCRKYCANGFPAGTTGTAFDSSDGNGIDSDSLIDFSFE